MFYICCNTHSQNFVACISFLQFLQHTKLCKYLQTELWGGGTGANSTVTAAPRWPQLKLAQMTLYANIFKISLLFGVLFFCPLCKQLVQHPLPPLLLPWLTQLAAFALITQILSGRKTTTRGGKNKILHINIIKYAMMNFIERITIVISLSGMLPMPSSPKYSP